ncbi:MAG: hypothetical protein R3A46_12855 [Thermomicrobiales bacterium]
MLAADEFTANHGAAASGDERHHRRDEYAAKKEGCDLAEKRSPTFGRDRNQSETVPDSIPGRRSPRLVIAKTPAVIGKTSPSISALMKLGMLRDPASAKSKASSSPSGSPL